MSVMDGAPGKKGNASGELGVRTALRTHSRNAVRAGTLFALPGSVTVTCARFALGSANALTALGATLRSPASPMSRPWLGSSELPLMGAARLPGPETLRILASKSSISSKIAE